MNDLSFQSPNRLTGGLSPEEKVRMVAAIDHDARTPQQVIAMTLLRLQLLAGELEQTAHGLDPAKAGHLATDPAALARLLDTIATLSASIQTELTTTGAMTRQVVDLQQDIVDTLRMDLEDTKPEPRTMLASEALRRAYQNNVGLAANAFITLRAARSRLEFCNDERWIDRILNNLVANAIRHSQGSKIFVGARQRGGDIVFEVRDNGRGIKPEALERIFDPRGPAPKVPGVGRSTASSGLGLYIVRQFAQRMGGSVSVRSQPGTGTVFEVRLPGPVDIKNDVPRRASDVKTRKAVKNKFVAVLDDDVEILKATRRLFEGMGVQVLAHEEPVPWFNGLNQVPRMPDLFVMDFQLRGQENVEWWLNTVKRKWGDQNPRIVVVTGHLNNPALLRISKTTPVLRKPLNAARMDLLIGILAGEEELPEAGFL